MSFLQLGLYEVIEKDNRILTQNPIYGSSRLSYYPFQLPMKHGN